MVVIYLVLLYCCWCGNQHVNYVVPSVTEYKKMLNIHTFLIVSFSNCGSLTEATSGCISLWQLVEWADGLFVFDIFRIPSGCKHIRSWALQPLASSRLCTVFEIFTEFFL